MISVNSRSSLLGEVGFELQDPARIPLADANATARLRRMVAPGRLRPLCGRVGILEIGFRLEKGLETPEDRVRTECRAKGRGEVFATGMS